MSATAQAEIVHHEVCDPTLSSRGFTVECWEDTESHRFYSDPVCTNELTRQDLAKAVVYAKLPSNPITGKSEFEVVEFDNTETWDVNMNWAAETTFSNATAWSITPRYAEFTVEGNNVANARLVWMKNQENTVNGRFAIKIYVKDAETQVSTEVYSFTQTDSFEGVNIQYLHGLKKGDIVKFEVTQISVATWHEASPTFKACLEYHLANTVLNANEDPDNEGNFYTTFYDSNCAYTLPHGVQAYTATIENNAGELVVKLNKIEGNILPKGEAVLLYSDVSDKMKLTPTNEAADNVDDNMFRGVDEKTTQEDYGTFFFYMLSYGQNKLCFYRMNDEMPLSAHKAFLPMSADAQVRAMRMEFADDECIE